MDTTNQTPRLAFDPSATMIGGYPLQLIGTVLNWGALGCDPAIIAENSKRIKGRVEPVRGGVWDEPAAIVAFGPSLRETWPELTKFKVIFSCSGAHKFLLERGIVPTYHADSEPRPHKIALVGPLDKRVTYLPASIVNRNYIDALLEAGVEAKLWHLLLPKPQYDFIPKGEWVFTGGNTIGPRTIKLARIMGFNHQHLFGFDGSGKHAAEHNNEPPDEDFKVRRFGGNEYRITEHMLSHINIFCQDLNRMPDLKITFHGYGMLPDFVRHYKRTPEPGFPLAVVKHD